MHGSIFINFWTTWTRSQTNSSNLAMIPFVGEWILGAIEKFIGDLDCEQILYIVNELNRNDLLCTTYSYTPFQILLEY